MAEASYDAENSMIEMNAIGSAEQYHCGYSSSESEREETDDLVGSLTELHDKGCGGAGRSRTRTCCSTCSCSGVSLWHPPDNPSEINMLDVP